MSTRGRIVRESRGSDKSVKRSSSSSSSSSSTAIASGNSTSSSTKKRRKAAASGGDEFASFRDRTTGEACSSTASGRSPESILIGIVRVIP